ncbi:MAG: hypothetical protein WEA58_10895 [Balneolaceae bacterium]
MKKPEISIKSISGGIEKIRKTGKYPDYYTLRSRKYKQSWRFEGFPAELKIKGELVYKVVDEDTILDKFGKRIDDIELVIEMRD